MNLNWSSAQTEMRAVYDGLSLALAESDFYLAGGTALALLEGHRVSVDLDLFSPTLSDAEALLEGLQNAMTEEFTVTSIGQESLYLEIAGVQASFISYRYPLLRPALRPHPGALRLADRDDIATMKLSAITNRGSRKDFVDLWVLIDRHRPLPDYLDLFKKRYSKRDVGHVIRSLVYFAEADNDPPLRLQVQIPWEKVKSDIRAAVQGMLEL